MRMYERSKKSTLIFIFLSLGVFLGSVLYTIFVLPKWEEEVKSVPKHMKIRMTLHKFVIPLGIIVAPICIMWTLVRKEFVGTDNEYICIGVATWRKKIIVIKKVRWSLVKHVGCHYSWLDGSIGCQVTGRWKLEVRVNPLARRFYIGEKGDDEEVWMRSGGYIGYADFSDLVHEICQRVPREKIDIDEKTRKVLVAMEKKRLKKLRQKEGKVYYGEEDLEISKDFPF
jgi:hypothetical protein